MAARLGAVACDLDGTLLGDGASSGGFDPTHVDTRPHISPANVAALRQLSAQGVPVLLATGRVASSAALAAEVLGLDPPMVTNNGACVFSSAGPGRKLLAKSFFEAALVAAAVRLGGELGVPVLLHHPDSESSSGQGISCCGSVEGCDAEHVHEYVNADVSGPLIRPLGCWPRGSPSVPLISCPPLSLAAPLGAGVAVVGRAVDALRRAAEAGSRLEQWPPRI